MVTTGVAIATDKPLFAFLHLLYGLGIIYVPLLTPFIKGKIDKLVVFVNIVPWETFGYSVGGPLCNKYAK